MWHSRFDIAVISIRMGLWTNVKRKRRNVASVQNVLNIRIEDYLYSVLHPRNHNQNRRWVHASARKEIDFFFLAIQKERTKYCCISWWNLRCCITCADYDSYFNLGVSNLWLPTVRFRARISPLVFPCLTVYWCLSKPLEQDYLLFSSYNS